VRSFYFSNFWLIRQASPPVHASSTAEHLQPCPPIPDVASIRKMYFRRWIRLSRKIINACMNCASPQKVKVQNGETGTRRYAKKSFACGSLCVQQRLPQLIRDARKLKKVWSVLSPQFQYAAKMPCERIYVMCSEIRDDLFPAEATRAPTDRWSLKYTFWRS